MFMKNQNDLQFSFYALKDYGHGIQKRTVIELSGNDLMSDGLPTTTFPTILTIPTTTVVSRISGCYPTLQ